MPTKPIQTALEISSHPMIIPGCHYEKDGVIYVLCGQGADGDYDGGDSLHLARYRSEDYGHSFVFDTLVDGTSEG